MRIYYINANCGDGSSCTEFYDSRTCIDALLSYDYPNSETYQDGDGGSWSYFTVPDGTVITDIEIRTLANITEDNDGI